MSPRYKSGFHLSGMLLSEQKSAIGFIWFHRSHCPRFGLRACNNETYTTWMFNLADFCLDRSLLFSIDVINEIIPKKAFITLSIIRLEIR